MLAVGQMSVAQSILAAWQMNAGQRMLLVRRRLSVRRMLLVLQTLLVRRPLWLRILHHRHRRALRHKSPARLQKELLLRRPPYQLEYIGA
jgi:hypothetical protein